MLVISAPSWCATRSQQPAVRIDEYMTAATNAGLFMGSVVVAKDGQAILSKGYAMANLEHHVANSPETKFDIGSVSKTFTAALVLRLQEKGALSVEDRLCNYLDDCPDFWREITLHHLLTHTSGITDYTELPGQFEERALASFIPGALTRIKKMPLQFAPGEKYSYSNTGYKLLNKVIEVATGRSLEAVLQETILNPLGMQNTGVFEKSGIRHLIIDGRAAGYTDGVGPLENAPWVYPTYGGGLYSTVEDMRRWGEGLLKGKVLSDEARKRAWTPIKGNYGYGWFVSGPGKRKSVLHGGNIPGFAVTYALYPDDGLLICVASNLDTAPTGRIHEDLAKIVFGQPYQLPPKWTAVRVNPALYAAYVGRYRKTDDSRFVITITLDGNQLWNRLGDDPGAAMMVLRPLSDSTVFNKMFVLYEATFVRDATGVVSTLLATGPWGQGEFKRIH